MQLAEHHNATFFEASSLTGDNCDRVSFFSCITVQLVLPVGKIIINKYLLSVVFVLLKK